MKDVTIKIKSKHIHDSKDEESMELITEAKMYERAGALYLLYDESEFTGEEGVKTRLKITKDSLKLTRHGHGGHGEAMMFTKGKRYEDKYTTPMGAVEIEILTNDFKNSMTYEGTGKCSLDYSISLKGMMENHSKMDISFLN